MKTYPITITEKLQMDVVIEAENEVQAREIAERNWKNGDYVLDADHFKGVTFTSPMRQDRER